MSRQTDLNFQINNFIKPDRFSKPVRFDTRIYFIADSEPTLRDIGTTITTRIVYKKGFLRV
jgi:hypothetical protein